MTTRTRQKALCAAVAACTLGLCVGPPPAQAAPCKQWGFAGRYFLKQSNGWTMFFDSTGPRALGSVQAFAKGGSMAGTIDGGVEGNDVRFVARWTSGPIGQYKGQIDANGFMKGITYDSKAPNSTATWFSDEQLRCTIPG